MKRLFQDINIIKELSVVMFMITLLSCNSIDKDTQTPIKKISEFNVVSVDTTVALFASYEKPDCHLKLEFELPESKSSSKTLDAINTMIIALTQDGSYSDNGKDVEGMIKQYTKSYILNYLEEGIDAIANYGEDLEAAANWMTYEETCNGKVIYNENNLFSYSVSLYSYTGGAHGNNSNRVATLDLNNRNIISLETMFDSGKLPILQEEIVNHLKEDGYQLLNEEIDLTDNFYLNNKGVSFVYDPFDVAAYSDGEIEVTVSWNDIKPLLSVNNPLLKNPIVNGE